MLFNFDSTPTKYLLPKTNNVKIFYELCITMVSHAAIGILPS